MKLFLNIFTIFVVTYCIIIFREIKTLNVLSELLIIGPVFFSYFIFSKYKSYTFFFITIFYSLGYPLYLAVMYKTFDQYNLGGWLSVGNFDFSEKKLDQLAFFASMIMFGTFIGVITYNFSLGRIKNNIKEVYKQDYSYDKILNYWFYSSIVLVLIMYILGIGRTGLEDKIKLPFGLKALLYYTRIIFIPLFGLFLLQIAYDQKNDKLLFSIFIKILIVSILISFASLSRSDVILTLFPTLFFLFSYNSKYFKKKLFKISLISIFFIVITTQVVQLYRNVSYSSSANNTASLTEVIEFASEFSPQDILDNLIILLTIRQGGARDLGVVLNSTYNDTYYIYQYFFQINEENFMYDVWNFRPEEFLVDGKSFGTGFNGFAWYAFGSNFLLVFFLSFFTAIFFSFVENTFKRNNLLALQLWVSFFIALLIWNSFLWTKFSRIAPAIFISLFIINYIKNTFFIKKTSHEF